jgi:hypothetical protein
MKSETVNQGRVFTSSQDDGARNAPALPVGGRVSRVEVTQSDDGPFLPPIEEPKGLLLKFVYAMSRWQFGKVLTLLKVVSARMPLAFGLFAGKIGSRDKKLLRRGKLSCSSVSKWPVSMSACFASTLAGPSPSNPQ